MCLWCPKAESDCYQIELPPAQLNNVTSSSFPSAASISGLSSLRLDTFPRPKSRADTFFSFQAPSSAMSHAVFLFSIHDGRYQVEDVVSSCCYTLLPVPSFYRHLLYLFSSTEFFYADWRLPYGHQVVQQIGSPSILSAFWPVPSCTFMWSNSIRW